MVAEKGLRLALVPANHAAHVLVAAGLMTDVERNSLLILPARFPQHRHRSWDVSPDRHLAARSDANLQIAKSRLAGRFPAAWPISAVGRKNNTWLISTQPAGFSHGEVLELEVENEPAGCLPLAG